MRFIHSLSAFVSAVFFRRTDYSVLWCHHCWISTIQTAVDSLSNQSTTAQSIFILACTYKEQVIIPARKATLEIYGYTTDTSSYATTVVTITHSSSLAAGAADDEATSTVINDAVGASLYKIHIKNTYGKVSQAVALAAYGDFQEYYGVGLYGYQDTLLAQVGNQVYAHCYAEGAVDFIFGQYAREKSPQTRELHLRTSLTM